AGKFKCCILIKSPDTNLRGYQNLSGQNDRTCEMCVRERRMSKPSMKKERTVSRSLFRQASAQTSYRSACAVSITLVVASLEAITISGTNRVPEVARVVWVIPAAIARVLDTPVVPVVIASALRDVIRPRIVARRVAVIAIAAIAIGAVGVVSKGVRSRECVDSWRYKQSRRSEHEATTAPTPLASASPVTTLGLCR